ncbi:MAG TPA: penicillin-binding protein 2 [Methyloceanibacter sp.]
MSETAKPDAVPDSANFAKGRKRFRLICLALALSFVIIGGRLVELGFAATDPGSGGLHDISSTVHRPDIFDRKGALLATDIKSATLYADPARVIDVDELVEQVTGVLPGVDAAELREKLKQGRRFVSIKRELSPNQQAEVHELGVPGLAFVDEYRRVYPVGSTACHVVGHVDTDNRGLAGIEQFIDENPQLSMASTSGESVTLALDLGVQHVLHEELAAAVNMYQAKAAAGIVIDVHSGEVVGMASLPDYDPNHREQALDKDRLNRINSGAYEMGSVFKVFTVASALDAGTVNLRSSYDASSPIHVASFTIDDFHGKKRRLTVPEIFIYSSNIGAAKMALDLGGDRQRTYLTKLGLLSRATTELGGSASPIVPARWEKLTTMTVAFGHGLSVTPLQLASAMVPLVNGGIAVPLTFLPRSREEGMSVGTRVLKRETSEAMLSLLRLNVLKGTGKRAEVEGFRVGGKTGTAEKVVGRHYSTSALLTSFLSTFPTDAPEYVVLVMLDEPQRVAASNHEATAGVNAAPTVGRIIKRIAPILGVSPKLADDKHKFDARLLASY